MEFVACGPAAARCFLRFSSSFIVTHTESTKCFCSRSRGRKDGWQRRLSAAEHICNSAVIHCSHDRNCTVHVYNHCSHVVHNILYISRCIYMDVNNTCILPPAVHSSMICKSANAATICLYTFPKVLCQNMVVCTVGSITSRSSGIYRDTATSCRIVRRCLFLI